MSGTRVSYRDEQQPLELVWRGDFTTQTAAAKLNKIRVQFAPLGAN